MGPAKSHPNANPVPSPPRCAELLIMTPTPEAFTAKPNSTLNTTACTAKFFQRGSRQRTSTPRTRPMIPNTAPLAPAVTGGGPSVISAMAVVVAKLMSAEAT